MDEIKLKVEGIEKSFPGVKALSNVNFAVRKGTVHALCGENGAGKSTLMKIINGQYKADKGQIYIDGQPVTIHNPLEASKYGIAMIPQELNYVPEMTVEENLFLGRLPVNKFGKVNWKKVHEDAKKFIEAEHLPYKTSTKLKSLTVSDIQMLEIIKAVSRNAQIIIMDEPTSSITELEVQNLFDKIRELKKKGVSVIYISHKMAEVFTIADDITVLRDGSVVSSDRASDIDLDTVIARMVGRKLTNQYPKEEIPIGENVLEVKHFHQKHMFSDVSFNVRAGEIVGFAGLIGAGRTETMRAIYGLDPHDGGQVLLNGKEIVLKSPEDSLKKGVALLAEDRRQDGIIPIRSIEENASLASLRKYIYGGYTHSKKEREEVSKVFNDMSVKAPSLQTAIGSLSGGNQQKVLLARWLLSDPKCLILDEPTRGIDVGAKYEIYKLMTDIAKQGKAIVMVSSELPELIGMCDRIYIMCQGRITGCLNRSEFSQESIMRFATGSLVHTGGSDEQ